MVELGAADLKLEKERKKDGVCGRGGRRKLLRLIQDLTVPSCSCGYCSVCACVCACVAEKCSSVNLVKSQI